MRLQRTASRREVPRSGSRLHHLPVTQTPRESGRSPDSRSNRSPGLLAYRCGGSVGLAYCVCVAHRLPVSSGGASRSFPWTPDSGAGVWNIRPMLSTRTNGGAEGDRRARRRRMAGSATGGRAVWAVSEARLRPKLVEGNRAASPVVSKSVSPLLSQPNILDIQSERPCGEMGGHERASRRTGVRRCSATRNA